MPTSDDSAVPMVMMAYTFIHGGNMRRTHCGTTIFSRICERENASEAAASHCADGMEATAPRNTSAIFALAGRASPSVTLSQSGNGTVVPNAWISNGNTYVVK